MFAATRIRANEGGSSVAQAWSGAFFITAVVSVFWYVALANRVDDVTAPPETAVSGARARGPSSVHRSGP